jgi:polyisoprenyl-phosphate glycosyltransferase
VTTYSIVVPLCNEQEIVEDLITKILIAIERTNANYEVILVDDGSHDDTWKNINNVASINVAIKGIKLTRNFGQHYAISAGLKECKGAYAIIMDGDLQDRPEIIPALIEKINSGFDVVFVSRKNRSESYLYLLLQSFFFKILKFLSGMEFNKDQANFSIINRKVIDAFNEFPEYSRYYNSTIKWLGFKETFIEAEHGKRPVGKTSYSFKKRFRLASDIILSFSDRPLRIILVSGLTLFLTTLISGLFILTKFILYGSGLNSLGTFTFIILGMSGLLLSAFGILGLYVSKIFDEVKKRPLFVVQEKVNF